MAALAVATVGWVPAADAKPVKPVKPGGTQTMVACGQVITSSITVANDVGPCLGDGLVVRTSNVTVDLAGHTVLGAGSNPAGAVDQVGIHVEGASAVTVRNGTVRGFFAGVLIVGGTGNTISSMTVDHNIGLGKTLYNDGIILDGSTYNQVTGNTVTGNGPDAGIAMVNSADHNSIAHNAVTDNNVLAVGLGPGGSDANNDSGVSNDSKASFNVISDNLILRNGFMGINLGGSGPTSHDEALNNTIRDNGLLGINAGGNGHMVSHNTIDHNGYEQFTPPEARGQQLGGGVVTCGFSPQYCGPDPTTIEHNRVTENKGFGVAIYYNGSQSTGGTGIYGTYPPEPYVAPRSNLVQHNVITANTGDGIFVQCDQLYDADFNGSCLPASPPHLGMRFLHNVSRGNGGPGAGVTAWDLHDENPGCDHDVWSHNIADTANPPCTRAK